MPLKNYLTIPPNHRSLKVVFATAAIFVFIVHSSEVWSQRSCYFATEVFDVGLGPVDIKTADFNGDFIPDFVVSNDFAGTVSVLFGNDEGRLLETEEIDVEGSITELDVGDIDGDGDLDLVGVRTALGQTATTFVTIINSGDGKFQLGTAYGEDSDSFEIVLSDLDEDGDLDVALPQFVTDEILLFYNSGNGVFVEQPGISAGDRPVGLGVEDLDGDNDQDLVVTNIDPPQIVVFSNTDTGFLEVGSYELGPNPQEILIDDIDNDGHPDLVVVSNFQNDFSTDIAVLRNDGTGVFGSPEFYDVGGFTDPEEAVLGDLNLDGYLDLAVANNNGQNIQVLVNDGSGTFGEPDEYRFGSGAPSDSGPGKMVVANLHGNLAPELLTRTSDNYIVVLKNLGDGSFLTDDEYLTDFGSKYVATGDLDGDNDLDFVVSNAGPETVTVFFNGGDREFIDSGSYPLDHQNEDVCLVDMDADHDLDMVVMGRNNSISLLMNLSDGTFSSDVFVATGITSNEFVVGDLNGDDADDLIVLSEQRSTIEVYFNNGSGYFGKETTIALLGIVDPKLLHLEDFNNDDFLDLVVTNSQNDAIVLLINDQFGNLVVGPVYFSGDANSQIEDIAFADVNGDQFVDMAYAVQGIGANNGYVGVRLNDGTGAFGNEDNYGGGIGKTGVAFGDIDEDGDQDLAFSSDFSNQVFLLLNDGQGVFTLLGTLDVGFRPIGIELVDLDGDENLDVVTLNTGNDVSVIKGNGNGSFAAEFRFDTTNLPEEFVVKDFDGDSRPELVVTSVVFDEIWIMQNNGLGFFLESEIYSSVSVASPEFYDVDGDQDCDLFFAGNQTIQMVPNHGGEFRFGQLFPISSMPDAVTVGDLNGDEIPDVISTNGTSQIAVLMNTGNGFLFEPEYYPTGGDGASSISLNDVELDGDLDVIVTNQHDNVAVLRNFGDGSFSAPETFTAGTRPIASHLEDFDRDGASDLVVVNEDSHDISVFSNNGAGVFSNEIRYETGGQFPKDVAGGDMNNDGVIDLVVANTGTNDIAVFFGVGNGEFENRRRFFNPNRPLDLAVVDFDADGLLDVLTGNVTNENISVMWHRCSATFAIGDINQDGSVDLLDISPFVQILNDGVFQFEADINQDGVVDLLDVQPFVDLLIGN